MKYISIGYKAYRKIKGLLLSLIYTPLAKIKFILNGAQIDEGLKVRGIIKIFITRRGNLKIGKNCSINSGLNHNISGGNQKNNFWIDGNLTIGNDVGMSSSSFFCRHSIVIGNNVIIGGNTLIVDTDSHSLDFITRSSKERDLKDAKKGGVIISNNVFIGARSTILKGVTIGENSIIGACSVVTKDIPKNELWAGNPAKFIRTLNN